MKIFSEEADTDRQDSISATFDLQNQILGENDGAVEAKTRNCLRNERQQRNQEKLRNFLETADDDIKRMMETLNQKGVSNWLTVTPKKDQSFELSKARILGCHTNPL